MFRSTLLLASLALGCASIADPTSSPDGGGAGESDAAVVEVPLPDAGEVDDRILLTQTSGGAIVPNVSFACGAPPDLGPSSFYRVFDLPAMGYPDGVDVEEVRVGLERATSSLGTQRIKLRVHTLAGPFKLANLTLLGAATVDVADLPAPAVITADLAVKVPAGARMVLEYLQPRGPDKSIYIGSVAGNQTAPAYWKSVDCGKAEPYDFAGDHPAMRIVLEAVARPPG